MIVLTHAKLLWLCHCPQPENRQHGFNGLVGSFRWGKFPRTDLLPSCYPQSILAGKRTERLLLQQFAFSLCLFWVWFTLSIALRHGRNVVRALGGSLRAKFLHAIPRNSASPKISRYSWHCTQHNSKLPSEYVRGRFHHIQYIQVTLSHSLATSCSQLGFIKKIEN